MKVELSTLVRRVAKLEATDEDSVGTFMSLIRKKFFAAHSYGSLCAEMGLTVETRKPNGRVSFRR